MTERAIVHIAATVRKALCGVPMTRRDWHPTGTVDTCSECRTRSVARRRGTERDADLTPSEEELLIRALQARFLRDVGPILPFTMTPAEMSAEADRQAVHEPDWASVESSP